jgi:hypothetical protein
MGCAFDSTIMWRELQWIRLLLPIPGPPPPPRRRRLRSVSPATSTGSIEDLEIIDEGPRYRVERGENDVVLLRRVRA